METNQDLRRSSRSKKATVADQTVDDDEEVMDIQPKGASRKRKEGPAGKSGSGSGNVSRQRKKTKMRSLHTTPEIPSQAPAPSALVLNQASVPKPAGKKPPRVYTKTRLPPKVDGVIQNAKDLMPESYKDYALGVQAAAHIDASRLKRMETLLIHSLRKEADLIQQAKTTFQGGKVRAAGQDHLQVASALGMWQKRAHLFYQDAVSWKPTTIESRPVRQSTISALIQKVLPDKYSDLVRGASASALCQTNELTRMELLLHACVYFQANLRERMLWLETMRGSHNSDFTQVQQMEYGYCQRELAAWTTKHSELWRQLEGA